MVKKKNNLLYLVFTLSLILMISACSVYEGENPKTVERVKLKFWSDWIKTNHNTITSIESDDTDYSDLMFLESILNGKNLVQLGENCHGVSEFNKVKVRLIKFMHEVLGYQVIAFESSIFECNMAQLNIKDLSPEELMRSSIFGVWYCDETIELFNYIKSTQSTNNPLILAGFDVQRSSTIGLAERSNIYHDLVSKIDPDYAASVLEKDKEFLSNVNKKEWLIENRDLYIDFYKTLYEWIDLHMNTLVKLSPDKTVLPLIMRQTAWSMKPYIECSVEYGRNDVTEYYSIRDLGMATNVKFLKEQLYPGKKIMVWAHNGHIQNNETNIKGGGPIAKAKNMGHWLSRWFSEEIYTIGLFMYKGQVSSTNRWVYSLGTYETNSLESIFAETNKEYVFLDLQNLTEVIGNSWAFEYITSTEWEDRGEREDEILIHKDHYNGIIFIRNVTPPAYLPYSNVVRLMDGTYLNRNKVIE